LTPGDSTQPAGRLYGVPPTGYRLPGETHVGAVHLQIADLDRSIGYYRDVLGLAVQSQGDGAARLGPRESDLALVHLRERPGARPAPRRGAYGLYHFAILLPDRPSLGRFATHAAGQGVRMGMADHLVSEALYLTDPDGLGIEVYADRPRSTWQLRGSELAMATDPLDIEGVMAAGGEQTWDGMPAGTVMGHVHLHVGDLDQADAFYHGALGFDRIVWSYPGALFLSAGDYHHHLGTNTWSPGPSAAEGDARLLEWELVVPGAADATAAAASLRAAGYSARDTGSGWVAADPWGTEVRVTLAGQ
jgi:catechol 2,3-dioxygenase